MIPWNERYAGDGYCYGTEPNDFLREQAAALAAERAVQLETVTADLRDWRLEARRWDAVVSIWCHLPPTLRRDVYRRVAGALEPGGVPIVEAYTPAQLAFGTGGPSDPALMPTLAQLREELAGLEFDVARECERDVREGRGHSGRSAVVQVLARRPA